ncbi:hypothetical protein Pan44_38730 [Caulifigura coniformis]|uniref:Uncharacterized protein n=1 Tax=Caulifigura coniformis TaxID=2527983 RepID=A0A517SI82_9PLAN|nr:hypothetical protein [Caulifigura coniformis]QDT55825.1 hypothetical protein Pan44_38730 [Caulifigura coniformis]
MCNDGPGDAIPHSAETGIDGTSLPADGDGDLLKRAECSQQHRPKHGDHSAAYPPAASISAVPYRWPKVRRALAAPFENAREATVIAQLRSVSEPEQLELLDARQSSTIERARLLAVAAALNGRTLPETITCLNRLVPRESAWTAARVQVLWGSRRSLGIGRERAGDQPDAAWEWTFRSGRQQVSQAEWSVLRHSLREAKLTGDHPLAIRFACCGATLAIPSPRRLPDSCPHCESWLRKSSLKPASSMTAAEVCLEFAIAEALRGGDLVAFYRAVFPNPDDGSESLPAESTSRELALPRARQALWQSLKDCRQNLSTDPERNMVRACENRLAEAVSRHRRALAPSLADFVKRISHLASRLDRNLSDRSLLAAVLGRQKVTLTVSPDGKGGRFGPIPLEIDPVGICRLVGVDVQCASGLRRRLVSVPCRIWATLDGDRLSNVVAMNVDRLSAMGRGPDEIATELGASPSAVVAALHGTDAQCETERTFSGFAAGGPLANADRQSKGPARSSPGLESRPILAALKDLVTNYCRGLPLHATEPELGFRLPPLIPKRPHTAAQPSQREPPGPTKLAASWLAETELPLTPRQSLLTGETSHGGIRRHVDRRFRTVLRAVDDGEWLPSSADAVVLRRVASVLRAIECGRADRHWPEYRALQLRSHPVLRVIVDARLTVRDSPGALATSIGLSADVIEIYQFLFLDPASPGGYADAPPAYAEADQSPFRIKTYLSEIVTSEGRAGLHEALQHLHLAAPTIVPFQSFETPLTREHHLEREFRWVLHRLGSDAAAVRQVKTLYQRFAVQKQKSLARTAQSGRRKSVSSEHH